MAITLTNPMSGDVFKTELEKALDKTGDTMDKGAPLNLGKNPENDMEAVPKVYIDNFINYLNNESPVLVRRDINGNVIYSSEELSASGFKLESGNISPNSYYQKTYNDAIEIDLSKNIFDYKAFYRKIRYSASAYCDGIPSPMSHNSEITLILKDENKNEIKTDTGRGYHSESIGISQEFYPTLDDIKNNKKFYVDIYVYICNNDSYPRAFTVTFDGITEQCELKHKIQYP